MRRAVSCAIALVLAASVLSAAPNSARRVRAFARLPDWTGLWETSTSKALTDPSATGPGPLKLAGHPPYNPEWEQKYQSAVSAYANPAKRAALFPPFKGCGAGSPAYVRSFPNIMEAPMVFQVVVTPEETLFVMDHGEVRHIYTDGRAHPRGDDLWPTPLGDSVGHWAGLTLVIDTIARTPGPISMFYPVAELSEQAHFIERVRQIDRDTLQDQLTINDPPRLLRPWTVTLRFTRVRDLDRFISFDCEEDRDPTENGNSTSAPH